MRSEAHLFIFLIDVYALLKNISVNKLRSAFSCKETEQSRFEANEHLHVMFFADFPTFCPSLRNPAPNALGRGS